MESSARGSRSDRSGTGRFAEATYHDWITDTTVDAGEAWGYMQDAEYKSAKSLIHYLLDNVSKNGYLLLNVGPKPDGTIPEEAQKSFWKWENGLKRTGKLSMIPHHGAQQRKDLQNDRLRCFL